jgi:hypothetical protein
MDKYYKLFPDLVEKIHWNFYFSVNLNKILCFIYIRSDSCSYISNIDISVHLSVSEIAILILSMSLNFITAWRTINDTIKRVLVPVKTDVGQVDLVLRLSDGTSEKVRFPNVPVRRTNLFSLNLVPNWYPIIFTCPFRSDSCSYVSNIDTMYFRSLKRFWDCDFNFVPVPVKTDIGQVDLVLRLSDGTSEKVRFPNVPVRRTNLFPLV